MSINITIINGTVPAATAAAVPAQAVLTNTVSQPPVVHAAYTQPVQKPALPAVTVPTQTHLPIDNWANTNGSHTSASHIPVNVIRAITVPSELHNSIKKIARARGISMSDIGVEIIERYLAKHRKRRELEDVFAAQPTDATVMVPIPDTNLVHVLKKKSAGHWNYTSTEALPDIADTDLKPFWPSYIEPLSNADVAHLVYSTTD